MLSKKCLLIGIFTLLSVSLAIADPPAVHPKTGEPLVIDCLRGTPDAIDGDLSDWNLKAMTPAVLDTEEQIFPGADWGAAAWTGPKDSSGKFYLLWDDDNIYIAVVMKDDRISLNKTGGSIWNADCIEIFFATTDAVPTTTPPSDIHYQYGFNANNQKWNWCNMDGTMRVEPDYLQVASTKTHDGYICEASIEYQQMLSLDFSVGNTIGFHPAFDDTDNRDRELQMTWTGFEAHDQSQGYGHLFLSDMEGVIHAWAPEPQDGALHPNTWATLYWRPGVFAVSHDMYFGEHFDDVNDGVAKTFQGNQTATSFDVGLPGGPYPDGLVLDTTYYWRIDEIEADGTTIHKGDVWSFTVVEAVTVEYAVSSSEDDGYAFNEEGQNLDFAYLRVGSSAFAQPPYYMSGMVFRGVNIPQDAEIISAYLKIRSHDSRLTDRVYGKVEAEAVDDAMAFGGTRHIGSLPRTTTSVDWDLNEPWSAHTWYESPDIADVIQEVIDHDGWSTGNSLAILYSTRQPGGGYRNFSSCDGDSGDFAPKLEITYGSK